ncbi:hypothetical protein HJG60_010145 [Phyllostomus discolor]|uniref:Uncharacterized protein n=1 Tax=Phyllostomus discolor TaxID=89673 RepID=A0A834AS51_9CHIR|nr:hypothetical protein HJG60_010145 [Phyllostomus discolor]
MGQMRGLRGVADADSAELSRGSENQTLTSVKFKENLNQFISPVFFFLFFKHFTYLFLEGGEAREEERERSTSVWLPLLCSQQGTWPATQACALTGNRTGDPSVHRPTLSPLSHTSQGSPVFFLLHMCKTNIY